MCALSLASSSATWNNRRNWCPTSPNARSRAPAPSSAPPPFRAQRLAGGARRRRWLRATLAWSTLGRGRRLDLGLRTARQHCGQPGQRRPNRLWPFPARRRNDAGRAAAQRPWNERQMLFQHLDRLGSGVLLLMDCGYPCRWVGLSVEAPKKRRLRKMAKSRKCVSSMTIFWRSYRDP